MGGRWLKRHDGWLMEKGNPVKLLQEEDQYGVVYVPLRCPYCRSKKVRCYVSRPPVRYHICRVCKKKFKSVEAG